MMLLALAMSLALSQQSDLAGDMLQDPEYNPFSIQPYIGGVQAPLQPSGRSSTMVNRVATRGPGASARPSREVTVSIDDLSNVRGQEDNGVSGVGLVVGLAGTGDSGNAAREAIRNLMRTSNINLPLGDISSANVAIVIVQATLPPGVKPGRKLDVRVAAVYDCDSLNGGTLLSMSLTDSSGSIVYASAEGPISTGGFAAGGETASVTKNHLTVGRVPNGGKVEREVKSELVNEHGFIYLDLETLKGSFENAVRITAAINEIFPGAAIARDAMTVSVKVPSSVLEQQHVSFLTEILARQVVPASNARIIINERTGVIIMGQNVRITPGAMVQGSLTISVASNDEASQPGPLSQGQTANQPREEVTVTEEVNPVQLINGAVTLEEVVDIMNLMGASPLDMIQILQSMAQHGMLHADIVVL
jgi:flagellar P-ring protein precursor FlgI